MCDSMAWHTLEMMQRGNEATCGDPNLVQYANVVLCGLIELCSVSQGFGAATSVKVLCTVPEYLYGPIQYNEVQSTVHIVQYRTIMGNLGMVQRRLSGSRYHDGTVPLLLRTSFKFLNVAYQLLKIIYSYIKLVSSSLLFFIYIVIKTRFRLQFVINKCEKVVGWFLMPLLINIHTLKTCTVHTCSKIPEH